jgi:hypothetical protein
MLLHHSHFVRFWFNKAILILIGITFSIVCLLFHYFCNVIWSCCLNGSSTPPNTTPRCFVVVKQTK